MSHPRWVSVAKYAHAAIQRRTVFLSTPAAGDLDAVRNGSRGHYRIPWREYAKVIEEVKE